MFLDPLVNRASSSLRNHDVVVKYLIDERKLKMEEVAKYRLGYTSMPVLNNDNSEDWASFMEETRKLFFLQKKLLIPLENSAGTVNGIITRSIVKDDPHRYGQFLTPEAKNIGAFFGLPQAIPSILKTGVVFVAEGAIYCITLARHYPNTVSTLTSFVNEEQMWTLKLLAETIVLVFDPDDPGRKGVEIVLAKYGSKGVYSREFGSGDPNKCLQKLGDEKFKTLLDKHLGGFTNFKKHLN